MLMFDFMLMPENFPFSVALMILIMIAILEGAGSLFGASLSNVISAFFPSLDVDVAIEGPDIDSPHALSRLLSWLRIGKVPILILFIIFLAAFGITGLMLQKICFSLTGFLLPAIMMSVPAFATALPLTRFWGGIFQKILPKDETAAVSRGSFVGRTAILTLGNAHYNNPAQGKVKDSFGMHHYIMIEPDDKSETFIQGQNVLLIRDDGIKFYAIDNHHTMMRDE